MRKDLQALPWLTAEQALIVLNDLLGYPISYGDLLSQCQYHQCEVFINLKDVKGTSSDALPVGEDEWTTACYPSGPQKVLNPEALIGTKRKLKMHLSGTVLTLDDDQALSHSFIDWEAEVDPDECEVRFQTSSVQKLADLISKSSKSMDPRERRSLHQIIAVLASMNRIDLRKPYAAYHAMAAEAASASIELGTDDTVAKHLEAARLTVTS